MHHAIQQRLKRFPMKVDTVTPRLCTALSRHFGKLWSLAKYESLSSELSTETPMRPSAWTLQRGDVADFCQASNWRLRPLFHRELLVLYVSTSIGIEMNLVLSQWHIEERKLKWFAPMHRDVLLSIERNGFSWGTKEGPGERDIKQNVHSAARAQLKTPITIRAINLG